MTRTLYFLILPVLTDRRCFSPHLDVLDEVSVSHFRVHPDGEQLAVSLVKFLRQFAQHAKLRA